MIGGRCRDSHASVVGRTLVDKLALLCLCCIVFLLAATPGTAQDPAYDKVLVLGFDGMDPDLLNQFREKGLLPNFDRFIAQGDFQPLGTTMPPASPVAWASFITGLNPGGHGIFDFFHRDPETMIPFLSVGEADVPTKWWTLGKYKFPRDGGGALLYRKGAAFWQFLSEAGIDATIFKVPSNFPPAETDARTLSGMGTPDITGTYGIFSYVTDNPPADADYGGGRMIPVAIENDRFEFELPGPVNSYLVDDPTSTVTVSAVLDPVHNAGYFEVDDTQFLLQEGEWSDWVVLDFEMIPMLKSVAGICRFYLMEARPDFRLYISPVQMDPAKPEMPISTPSGYSAELVDALGRYYTQGMPDDTRALDEGVLDDKGYVAQSTLVLEERMRQFDHELARFEALDAGFLFFYFNSPDQTSHMFWRNMDPESPMHEDAAGLYADRIQYMYEEADRALGKALDACAHNTLIIALSDHGFAPFHRAFHLNVWLYENGYIHLRPGLEPADVNYLRGIDWTRTKAYAFGINSLYINLAGRERRGIVRRGAEYDELLQELQSKLESVVDPEDGRPIIKYAYRCDEIYSGPCRVDGPDMMIGYHRGIRGSNESALGGMSGEVVSDNMLKWSGDHLIAADEVPGIIVSNRKILKPDPSLLDLAPTILRLFDLEPIPEMVGGNLFAEKGDS
ncbi:MAG: alkaline phosphatase family protein [bacterium]